MESTGGSTQSQRREGAERPFVSYARVDAVIVNQLVAELHDLGYDPFFDKEITGGERWWEVILDRIEDADVFIPLVTRNYLDSEACYRETRWASDLNVTILPLDVEGIDPRLCPRPIAEANWVSYRRTDRLEIAQLSRSLRQVQPRVGPAVKPDRPAIPITYYGELETEIRRPMAGSRQEVVIASLTACLGSREDEVARRLLKTLQANPSVSHDRWSEIQGVLRAGEGVFDHTVDTRWSVRAAGATAERPRPRSPDHGTSGWTWNPMVTGRRWRWVLAVVVVACLVALAGWAVLNRGAAQDETERLTGELREALRGVTLPDWQCVFDDSIDGASSTGSVPCVAPVRRLGRAACHHLRGLPVAGRRRRPSAETLPGSPSGEEPWRPTEGARAWGIQYSDRDADVFSSFLLTMRTTGSASRCRSSSPEQRAATTSRIPMPDPRDVPV